MPVRKELPLDFWCHDDEMTPLNVLAGTLNLMRRPIDNIDAFGQILLKRELSEEMRVDVQAIVEDIAYLRSVMEAALEYKNKLYQ